MILIMLLILTGCSDFKYSTDNKDSNNMKYTSSEQNAKSKPRDSDIKGLVWATNDGNTLLYYKDKRFILKTESETNEYCVNNYPITSNDNIYMSEDAKYIYYLSSQSTPDTFQSEIIVIDAASKQTYSLSEKIGLKKNYQLTRFSYCDGFILALISQSDNLSKKLQSEIIINIKDNSFEPVKRPLITGIEYSNPIMYIDGKILTFYTHNDYKDMGMAVVDKDGKVYKKYNKVNIKGANDGITFSRPSNDGKYILISLGKTPIDLYLFDVENNKNYDILNETTYKEGRLFANWNDTTNFYLGTFSMTNKENRLYKKSVNEVINR